MSLIKKLCARDSQKRFQSFMLVGLSGVGVHLLMLALFLKIFNAPFWLAQLIALLIAMISNFLLNNLITYRDRRLHGKELWQGLLSFCLACSIGTGVNVLAASYLYALGMMWALAGFLGAVAGAVWNYITTALFTWKAVSRIET